MRRPCAVALKSTDKSGQLIRDIWQRVGEFETAPSMSALGYAPHISLLVFDEADPEELAKVALPILRATPPLAVTFSAMSWFLEPKRVLWAAPDEQSVTELRAMHRALHRALPTVRCHPHYALGAWTPHCTLGLAFRDSDLDAAERFAAEPLARTDVIFDTADVVTFPPIDVFAEAALHQS